jgi:hypothetical protein
MFITYIQINDILTPAKDGPNKVLQPPKTRDEMFHTLSKMLHLEQSSFKATDTHKVQHRTRYAWSLYNITYIALWELYYMLIGALLFT